MVAAEGGHNEMVNVLLSACADINWKVSIARLLTLLYVS